MARQGAAFGGPDWAAALNEDADVMHVQCTQAAGRPSGRAAVRAAGRPV